MKRVLNFIFGAVAVTAAALVAVALDLAGELLLAEVDRVAHVARAIARAEGDALEEELVEAADDQRCGERPRDPRAPVEGVLVVGDRVGRAAGNGGGRANPTGSKTE